MSNGDGLGEPYERTVVINLPTTVTLEVRADDDGVGHVQVVTATSIAGVSARDVEECLDASDELQLLDPEEAKKP